MALAHDARFVIGGCVYRMAVRAEHCGAVAALAAASIAATRKNNDARVPEFLGVDYRHTSNLPQGRARWLRDLLLRRELTHVVSMDSDTWFTNASMMLAGIALTSSDWAMGIAPVRQGGTERNNLRVLDAEGKLRDLRWDEIGEAISIHAGGFGLVVFNLDWFRANWPEPEPERVSIATGEDIEFCLSVGRRGGFIRRLPVPTCHREFLP